MSARVLRPLLLLLCLLGLLAPGGALAAPRPSTGVVAHQDPAADDDPWAADEDGWTVDDPTAEDDPSLPADSGTVDGATDDPAADDGLPADPAAVPAPVVPVPAPAPVVPAIEYVTGRTVPGKVAGLRRDGRAAIPRSAPKRVRRLIAAANRIVGKPYKWGGGHARLVDRGYDCSGTVSYALIRSGLLDAPLVSRSFAKWGRAEAGRWVTIYANRGHVYMEVAGLRLDTSPMGDPAGGSGPRWRPAVGWRRGFHVRHVAGL